MSTFFTDEEIKYFDPEFVELLDLARKLAGVTFDIKSKIEKPTEGEIIRSIDFKCDDPHARFHIIRSCTSAGLDWFTLGPDYITVKYGIKPGNRIYLSGNVAESFTL